MFLQCIIITKFIEFKQYVLVTPKKYFDELFTKVINICEIQHHFPNAMEELMSQYDTVALTLPSLKYSH